MAEVVRIVGDIGAAEVKPTVPDVMVGLPTIAAAGSSPDSSVSSGGGPGGYPGFMGEYMVRDVGSWWAIEGEQRNTLEPATGSCTQDRVSYDWAEFSCRPARFGFAFDMRVEPLRHEPLVHWSEGDGPPPAGDAEGSHQIGMRTTVVPGVRLTVAAWAPPP